MIDDCGKNVIYPINVMFQDTYLKKKKGFIGLRFGP